MEGGTDALASAGAAAAPIELEQQPYDELDIDVIRATQGDLPVVAGAVGAGGRASSASASTSCSRTCAG